MKREGKDEAAFYDMLVGRAHSTPDDTFAAKEY